MYNYKLQYFKPTHFSFTGNELSEVIAFAERTLLGCKKKFVTSFFPLLVFGSVFLFFEIGISLSEPWYTFYDKVGVDISFKDYVDLSPYLGILITSLLLIVALNLYSRHKKFYLMISQLGKIKFSTNSDFEIVYHTIGSYLRNRKSKLEAIIIIRINQYYLCLQEVNVLRKKLGAINEYSSDGSRYHICAYSVNSNETENFINKYLKSTAVTIAEVMPDTSYRPVYKSALDFSFFTNQKGEDQTKSIIAKSYAYCLISNKINNHQ